MLLVRGLIGILTPSSVLSALINLPVVEASVTRPVAQPA
jgi:hypothetical protein